MNLCVCCPDAEGKPLAIGFPAICRIRSSNSRDAPAPQLKESSQLILRDMSGHQALTSRGREKTGTHVIDSQMLFLPGRPVCERYGVGAEKAAHSLLHVSTLSSKCLA